MLDQLLLNTRVHLRFYARNRLLLAFAIVLSGVFGLTMIPMVMMDTSANRFSLLQSITGQLGTFSMIFTASLGLFALSSHLRNRNVKMVLTKPCRPETWLASIFLSALLVGLALHGLIAVAGMGLSLFWSIPLQPGLAFVAIDGFLRSVILFSFVTMLTMAFHPVVAVLVVSVVNEETFYGLKYLIASAGAANGSGPWLTLASVLCDGVYMLLPMVQPLGDRTEGVYRSWRATGGDWLTLGGGCGYALLVTLFLYLLSLYLLRRKDLV
jgi:hypothetical protein